MTAAALWHRPLPGEGVERHDGAGDIERNVEHVGQHAQQRVSAAGQTLVSAQLLRPLHSLRGHAVAGGTAHTDYAAAAANAPHALLLLLLLLLLLMMMMMIGRCNAPKTVHTKGYKAEEGEVELDLPVVSAVAHEAV
jgi:hypothetical protein